MTLDKPTQKEFVYVMRHGATAMDISSRSDGYVDLPLSDEGREGLVETLSDHLKLVPITCIYAAPLRRTEETAHILKSGMASDPEIEIVDEALPFDLGTLGGEKKEVTKPQVQLLIDNPSKSAPNGESYDDFTERFDPWLEKMEKESKTEGPLLLVLSGSNLRRISELLFGDRETLDLDEAGLAVLSRSVNGKWTAETLCGAKEDHDELS